MEKDAKYQNVLNDIEYYENIGYFKAALDICARVEYLDVPIIQSKRLFILTKRLNDYERAYNIFRQVKKMKDPSIQAIGIQILNTLGLHDEIKRLIIENGNIESNTYKYALMEYYMNRRQYDKALDICNEPFCASQEIFQNHKKYIKKLKYRTREGLVYEYLMRLYADDINISEIRESSIGYFNKDVLSLAYYEKYNPKRGINEVKKYKRNPNYKDKEDEIKTLNTIQNRLMSKKTRINYDFYKNILGVSFDLEEAHKYMEEKKEKEEFKTLVNSIIKNDKSEKDYSVKLNNIADPILIETTKKIERKMVGVTGVNVNSRYNNINIVNAPVHVPEKKVTLIKDEYAYELEELQRALYCMMKPGNMTDEDINRLMSYYKFVEAEELKKYAEKLEKNENALRDKMPIPKTPLGMVLKAYDNLEALADNPITNKEKLMRFLSILLKAGTSEDVFVYNAENKSFDKKPSDKIIDINTDRILKEYNKLKIK